MKMNKDEMKMHSAEYAEEFNTDRAPTEQSEDDAFGLTPSDADQGAGTPAATDTPAVAIVVDTEAAPTDAPASEAETMAPAAAEGEGDENLSPEDLQRKRSWEGRLRKREEELAAREAALKGGVEAEPMAEEAAAGEGEGLIPDGESAGEAAGEMTAEQAADKLSGDFGDDFVKMIRLVAGASTSELGPRFDALREGLQDLTSDREQMHFEMIEEAHPDFLEVANSQALKDWVASKEGEEKAAIEATIANGRTRAVIKMIDRFKAETAAPAEASPSDTGEAPADGVSEDELAAAEGVRSNSSGLQLPEEAQRSEDYAAAWGEFEDDKKK